jgi:hypothetical protein
METTPTPTLPLDQRLDRAARAAEARGDYTTASALTRLAGLIVELRSAMGAVNPAKMSDREAATFIAECAAIVSAK